MLPPFAIHSTETRRGFSIPGEPHNVGGFASRHPIILNNAVRSDGEPLLRSFPYVFSSPPSPLYLPFAPPYPSTSLRTGRAGKGGEQRPGNGQQISKTAASYAATSWRLRAGLRPGANGFWSFFPESGETRIACIHQCFRRSKIFHCHTIPAAPAGRPRLSFGTYAFNFTDH